jgi:hypothetical protein
MFRLTVNAKSINGDAKVLGDRTLTGWVGTAAGGILHMPTYTFTNLNGGGNVNYVKNIGHKNRIVAWHFIYYGYSRSQSKARVYVKFLNDDEELNYANTHHYLPEKFLLYVGRDMHGYQHYSGRIGYFRVVLGKGAFNSGKKFDDEEDPWGYVIGFNKLVKETVDDDEEEPPKPTDDVIESQWDKNDPALDKEHPNLGDLKEYGYGFWLRFLTTYPNRLPSGKNAAWYFVARLTKHKEYDNVRMGDRQLAIW